MRTCSVEGCNDRHRGRGYCNKHYDRFKAHGDPLGGQVFRVKLAKECEIEGCDNKPRARNLCGKHHQRLRKHGDPHYTKQSKEYGQGKEWYLGKDGYILRWAGRGHPNATGHGNLYQHRHVMSKMIGRTLKRGENVHHKNGDRSDNRPENLELWVKGQPAGHRVEDKVMDSARMIIDYYSEARELSKDKTEFDRLMNKLANTLKR